jgi:hypothetical protein
MTKRPSISALCLTCFCQTASGFSGGKVVAETFVAYSPRSHSLEAMKSGLELSASPPVSVWL